MRILVTAGNTQTPIDRVRCITNVFTGKTGTHLALAAYDSGHEVTLVTSHPEIVHELYPTPHLRERWAVHPYRTYDDLADKLETLMTSEVFDAVIHCAAVSDYRVEGVYDAKRQAVQGGKIKSGHDELWLKLTPTPKLVDRFRAEWKFAGSLVKFKLEVGLTEIDLLKAAEASRAHSLADWMVANLFETRGQWAYIGNAAGYKKITRNELPAEVLRRIG